MINYKVKSKEPTSKGNVVEQWLVVIDGDMSEVVREYRKLRYEDWNEDVMVSEPRTKEGLTSFSSLISNCRLRKPTYIDVIMTKKVNHEGK